jgi:sugar phosphate isomerase/epimerase
MDAFTDVCRQALASLCRQAAAVKVPLSFSIMNGRYQTDDMLNPDDMSSEVYRVYNSYLQQNGFRSVYAHLDTFHMQLEEESFTKAIRSVAGKLGYFHIADSTRWYPGSGYLDFKEILRALEEIGYDGYLALECFPHEDNEDTARKGLQYMKFIQQTIV